MRLSAAALAAICIFAPGCATHRDLPSEERVNIGHVLDQVVCELHGAIAGFVQEHYAKKPEYHEMFVKKWSAAASLTLETTDEGGVSGGYLFGNPLVGGILRLTVNATATQKVHRLADLTVSFDLKDLMELGCVRPAGPDGRSSRFFSNDAGVAEWFSRAANSLHAVGSFPPDKLSHAMDFTVTKSGDGKAAWTFTHNAPSVFAKLSVQDTYQLKVAFSPKSGPTRVHVVNFNEIAAATPSPPATTKDERRDPAAATTRRLQPASPETRQQLYQQLYQLDNRTFLQAR